jgi:hypothetical protein
MSINSMTNAAAARRTDFVPLNAAPSGLPEIAMAAAGFPATADPGGAAPNPGSTTTNDINTAMHVLFDYIPTEVLTLYVAVVAAIHPATAPPGPVQPGDWYTFVTFLIATPIIFWLVYAAKLKSAKKPLPIAPAAWPVWEMSAATIAYAAWAFALPNTPFREFGWYTTGLGSVIVLVTSTVLGLLAPLFQRPLPA